MPEWQPYELDVYLIRNLQKNEAENWWFLMWKLAANRGTVGAFLGQFDSNQKFFLKSEYRESRFCFQNNLLSLFGVWPECTDLRYAWFGPKRHIFGCNLHHFTQNKVYLFIPNLKNLVQAGSQAILHFCWQIKNAWMVTLWTWCIFDQKPSKNWSRKLMILNVKVSCK